MVFNRRKKKCAVHGKGTKPVICKKIAPEEIHGNKGDICEQCGTCCNISVKVDPKSPQTRAMIEKIKENAHILRRANVDAEKVIRHIEKEGRVPLRRNVDAGDLQWDNFLFDSSCSLLMPEQAYDKNWKKTRRQGS